jgi:hypothetical protein
MSQQPSSEASPFQKPPPEPLATVPRNSEPQGPPSAAASTSIHAFWTADLRSSTTNKTRWQLAILLVLVVLNAILFSRGPSTQERRACEMYRDAANKMDLAYWVKHFNRPEEVAEIEAHNAKFAGHPYIKQETPQSRAESKFAYGEWMTVEALDVVSARLSISLREVVEALEKCEKAKKQFF